MEIATAVMSRAIQTQNHQQNKQEFVRLPNDWGCTAAHWVAMTRNEDASEIRELCTLLSNSCGIGSSFFCQTQKQGHSALHKAAQVRL